MNEKKSEFTQNLFYDQEADLEIYQQITNSYQSGVEELINSEESLKERK